MQHLINNFPVTKEETIIENRLRIYSYVKIACSYYTLNVKMEKYPYWDSCINRDIKSITVYDASLSKPFKKSMSALNELEGNVISLKNQYKANDDEISVILGIDKNDVKKNYEVAMEKFIGILAENGIIVED